MGPRGFASVIRSPGCTSQGFKGRKRWVDVLESSPRVVKRLGLDKGNV